MSVPIGYITVIFIWSTTPLAIAWSSETVGYEFGVAARMSISLLLLLGVLWLRRLPLPLDREQLQIYLLGGVPMFIAMSSVYWSSQYIPSGWISVIFGLSPIITSLLAALLLGERAFAGGKLPGMLLGIAGLGVVFAESLALDAQAWQGVVAVLLSTLAHSASAVLLKRARPRLPALSITTGSLLVATPLFLGNLLLLGPGLPAAIPSRTLYAILYLAVLGSVIGFSLYYWLLTRLSAPRLALITLVTPISALLLGKGFNGELVSDRVWAGTALVLAGLALYEYGHRLPIRGMRRRFALRWWQRPM